MQDMIVPKDDRLIYTIHCYAPDRFVFTRDNQNDTPFFDEKAKDELREMFEDIKKFGMSHQVPIMLTEFGCVAKRLPNGEWNTEERVNFTREFVKIAKSLNMPYVWWDNNYLERRDEYFALFDRTAGKCIFPEIVKAITE